MKRSTWTASFALCLLVIGCLATGAYAQPPMGGHGMGGPGGHGPMGMLHELNLTDAQKQQVKQIMEAHKTSMKPIMLQLEQNRLALLQVTSAGAYDAAKVQTLANQQAQLQAVMTVQHEALAHQIYTTVLTADQRAKADQMRAEEITRITEHVQKLQSGTETAPPPEQ